jgi:hypothetical protein
MTSRTLFRAAVVVALLSATAMPVLADATHNHPAANGTAAAPLDIVRAATDLAQPVGRSYWQPGGRRDLPLLDLQQEGSRPLRPSKSRRHRRS